MLPIRSAADFRAITKPQDIVFFMDARTNYSTHSRWHVFLYSGFGAMGILAMNGSRLYLRSPACCTGLTPKSRATLRDGLAGRGDRGGTGQQ